MLRKNEQKHRPEELILWSPALVASGILIYITAMAGMSLVAVLAFTSIISLLLWLCIIYASNIFCYKASQALLLVILGISSMALRVDMVVAPILERPLNEVWLQGTVSQIQKHKNGVRLWLNHTKIEGVSESNTPKIVRIVVNSKVQLEVGDKIRCMATLMPPQPAILPGKFDFAEYAYFKKIGAIGAATSKIRIIGHVQRLSYEEWLQALRHKIALRIMQSMPQPAAGVAIGLLIGDASFIEEDTAEDLRISGIAHLVAISGMHMVVVVAMIFLTIRWVLSWSTYITLHHNGQKIAALLSITGSFAYLLLAGSPISAQRAFIVSTLVLISITLERRTVPMRILMLSGICLLLLTPEALKNPSLQMSFAACIGLIAASEYTKKIVEKIKIRPYKLWRYLTGIILSSSVAGLATTPFLIYHFGTFSTYSVLTNVLAVPLNDFAIMLLGILGLLLMPINLEYWPWMLMGCLIDVMLWLAHAVSTLSGSVFHINSFSNSGLALLSLGGLAMALSTGYLRYGGMVLILLAMIWGYCPIQADVIVAAGGRLFVVQADATYYFSSKRRAHYIRKALMQYLGIQQPLFLKDWHNQDCDEGLCLIEKNSNAIILLADKSRWEQGCYGVKLFVNLYDDKVCMAAESNISKTELEQRGTHVFVLGQDGIHLEVAKASPLILWKSSPTHMLRRSDEF